MKKSKLFIYMKKSWPYMKKSKKDLLFYIVISIMEGILGTILPLVSAHIILNITDGVMDKLIYTALSVLLIESLINVIYYIKGYFYQKIYIDVLTDLQISVARETLKLDIREIDKVSSGFFIDRINKDTADISDIFMEYAYWISQVVSNIGVLGAIFILNKYLFVFSILVALCIFAINKIREKKQYEVHKKVKKIYEKKTGLTSELVRGIRDIKVLNAYDTILNQTSNKIIEAATEEKKMSNIRRRYNYYEDNAYSISNFLFLVYGSFLYFKDMISIPAFIIIYNYRYKIEDLLFGIVEITEYNKKFEVAAERIFEIIDSEKFQKEKFGNLHKDKLEGNIKFKNVSFSYDNKDIIHNMSFEIKSNETIAFVGKSGVGKTTLFNLITGLYHTNKGKILLDDIDINDLDINSIRNNMSIITQNPYIFNFSIKENLLLAKENATLDEIKEVCKLACIDEFIESLPDKYDTMLGENGIILSGGQKQRIAIARALLMKTEIILFDEATSALDNETQSKIQKAISNMKGEYTILIIAHRLSTIINSDKILFVNDGKIEISGTHNQLMKTSKNYKNLYESEIYKKE